MGSCGEKFHIQRTLAVLVLLILIAIAGGIIVWQYLPDHQKEAISGITGGGIPLGGSGGTAPAPNYTFIQCSSDEYGTCCNGLNGLCNLTLAQIIFAGVHNSQSSVEDGFYVAPNHQYHAVSALDYGYRVLNFDVGICNGELVFVHGLCKLGTTDPKVTFTAINQWLDAHPTEVILIPFQVVNELEAPVDLFQLYDILASIDGFTNRMFEKVLGEPWPSLGTMVELDQRIVIFQYNAEKSCSSALFGITSNYTCPPGFQDWFAYAGETEFQFDSVEQLKNKERACNITRGRPHGPIFALNVFLTVPSKKIQSTSLNTKSFLQDHIALCTDINAGLPVNVVFVDFWSGGNLPEVVQLHNTAVLQSQLLS
jgi:hypothetical protein